MKKSFNKFKNLSEILILSGFDLLSLVLIFHLSVIIRTRFLPRLYKGFPAELPFSSFINVWWIFLVWLFFFYYEGIYTKTLSFWDEVKTLWKTTIFSTVSIFTIVSIARLSNEISRTVIVLLGLFSILLLPLIKIIIKKILRKFGLLKKKVLILGAGETGKLIAGALKKEPNYGYEVTGFLDDDIEKVGKYLDGIKIHRGVDRAENYVKQCNITDIFIAMPGAGRERVQGLVNKLQHKASRILFVPDMLGIAVLGTSLIHFFHEQAFAFELQNNLSRPVNIFIKRCSDLLLGTLAITFLSVPVLIIALIIRLDSKGPAFFMQERVGKDGKKFMCLKFRTMYIDAEKRLAELLKNDAETKKEWDTYWKLKDDPRVTIIGRFLRSFSLDELPQLFNVLIGEMSLVGPRPYLSREIKNMGEHYHTILLTKPGITGLWQVSGRSSTTYNYRIALDSWYVKNWNLWLDIVIILKTFKVVLNKEGAY